MNRDFDQIDEMLLDEFNKAGLIESSTVKLYKSKKKLDEQVSLNENRAAGISPDEYVLRGVTVNGHRFAEIYQDYENYPGIASMMTAIGLPPALFTDITKDSYERQFRKIRDYFRNNKKYGYIFDIDVKNRKEYFYEGRNAMPQASMDKINPGKKNRRTNTTQVVNVLNGKEVVPGEFYTDISRIPKRKWGNWIKFWQRQVSRIKNNKSILGKVWQKVFIMGYQFSRGVVVEIWYNSATSDFSVYDQNGTELGRPAKSMQEAVRLFVTFLLSEYSSDKEVFAGKGGDMNSLAKSYLSAITRGANRDAIEAEREARLASIEKKSNGDPLASVSRITSASRENNKTKHAQQDRNREDWSNAAKGSFKDAFKKAVGGAKKGKEKVDDWVAKGAADDFVKRQQKNRDAFNQRQKEKYQQRTGATYDHDDDASSSSKSTVSGFPALTFQEMAKKAEKGGMGQQELKAIWDEYQRIYAKAREAQDRYEELKKKKEIARQNDMVEKATEMAREVRAAQQDIKKMSKDANSIIVNLQRKKFRDSVENDESSSLFENEDTDEILAKINTQMASNEMDREAQARRKMAQQSGFTTTAIRTSAVGEMLSMYEQTKVNPKHAGVIGRFLQNTLSIFRGRKDKVRLPTQKAGFFDRLQMSIIGTTYRADFVIGYSLKDAINIEIWYVTEPDPSKGSWDATSSSFYVYDVTAAKVIRSNLPYYRNALSVAMAKIAVNDEDVKFSTDRESKKGQSSEDINNWKRYHDSRRGL